MKSAVDVAEARRVDMSVYLRRADVRMAKKLLDRADVRAVLEHVRGKAVPENVRRNALWGDICGDGTLADHLEYRLTSKRLLEPSDEDV